MSAFILLFNYCFFSVAFYFIFRPQVKVCLRWLHLLLSPVNPNRFPRLVLQHSPSPYTALGPSLVKHGQLGGTSGLLVPSPATATPSLCPTSRRVLRQLLYDLTPLTSQMAPLLFCRSLRLWQLPPFTPCTLSRPRRRKATNRVVRAHCPAASPEVSTDSVTPITVRDTMWSLMLPHLLIMKKILFSYQGVFIPAEAVFGMLPLTSVFLFTVYGKPVLPASGAQQSISSDTTLNSGSCVSDGSEADSSCPGNSEGVGAETAERATPRPLSPTKLLPFLSNPHRNPSDVDLEALRRRLHHAPRPLKKRSSITEPEGPAGPNIQKLLYQKTTLAAMETIPMETVGPAEMYIQPNTEEEATSVAIDCTGAGFNQSRAESPDDDLTPPPLPPRSPIPDPASCRSLPPPLEDKEDEELCPSALVHQGHFPDAFPPYPPPPYPSCGEAVQGDDVLNLEAPEVTGQVTVPPVSDSD